MDSAVHGDLTVAITSLKAQVLSGGVIRYVWASDLEDPTFRVFRDGQLLTTMKATEFLLQAQDNQFAHVNVLDDDDEDAEPDRETFWRWRLQWNAVEDAAQYRIEQYIDAAWSFLKLINDTGQAQYEYTTGVLDDSSTSQFRVVPIDAMGNDGTPATLDLFPIHRPAMPMLSMVYDDGTKKATFRQPEGA
jgi:hypothetical protein